MTADVRKIAVGVGRPGNGVVGGGGNKLADFESLLGFSEQEATQRMNWIIDY